MKWCMDKRVKWRRRRNKAMCRLITGGDKYFYCETDIELEKYWFATPKEHYERYE